MLCHSRAWNNFLAAAGQVVLSNLKCRVIQGFDWTSLKYDFEQTLSVIFGYFKLCLLILVVCRIPAFCYSLKNLDGLWGNWAVTVNCLCALSGEASDSNPAWDTWWGCHLLAIWYFLALSPRPMSQAGRPVSGFVRPGTQSGRPGTMEQAIRTPRTAQTARYAHTPRQ